MKRWQIRYWYEVGSKSPIEKWLDGLDQNQLKAVKKEISILEVIGNKLSLPHSRALGKGLFELRERRYGYRIYYCFKDNQLIVLLASGNKASQKKDIIIARKRYKDSL